MQLIKSALTTILLVISFCTAPAIAQNTLPQVITAAAHARAPLAEVGEGTYTKLGFRVYQISLWAPNGQWRADAPYVLNLHYVRDISKDTLVDTVTDDIRDQNVTDDATLGKWQKILEQVLPEIKDGDTLTGISIPSKPALLFHNGTQIASINNPRFSKAFFDIWLGKTADQDLRADLLGQNS